MTVNPPSSACPQCGYLSLGGVVHEPGCPSLAREPKTAWIKTSEGAPQSKVLVLGYWPQNQVTFDYPEKPVHFDVCWYNEWDQRWYDGEWIHSSDPGTADPPSHWMYLPEPP